MKKIKILLFAIPLFFFTTGYLMMENDNLGTIIVKAVVNYENLKEETPEDVDVMDSWLTNMGVRSKYAILKSVSGIDILETLMGVKVFKSGPHSDGIDYYASSMGYYNPEFLEMAHNTLEQVLEDENFKENAMVLYKNRFQNMLRAFYTAHVELKPYTLSRVKAEYVNHLKQADTPKYFVDNNFYKTCRDLTNYRYEQYETYEMVTAMGFWMRRSIDGTDSQFLNLLNLVFEHLDPDFYKIVQLRNEVDRVWTNGEDNFGMEFFNTNTIAFGGGGLHERVPGFSISVNDKIQLFEYEDQRALILRNDKDEIKAWYKEMSPSEGLDKIVLMNMTNHQLAGRYVRADTNEEVIFLPNEFKVKGLSGEESYQFAFDDIEFPMELIFFSNGEGYGYEKTSAGLNLYKATSEDEYWYTGNWITTLKKMDGAAPDYSIDLPGRYPLASSEILTIGALKYYSKYDLQIMRNEIFARYGYPFNSAGMKEYFGNQKWYVRRTSDVANKLTPLEKLNIELIQFYEKLER